MYGKGDSLTREEKSALMERKSLTRLPTVELVRCIIDHSDRVALNILLETRRLFHLKDKPPLSLPGFLMELRARLTSMKECHIHDLEMADCAYDLTLAKYSNLPNPTKRKSNHHSVKGAGIDCRNYYRAFLRSMQWMIDEGKISSQSQEESKASGTLQNMVYMNYLRSRQECLRKTKLSIRYAWQVEGMTYYLWYPSWITSKEFREWLEENVRDVSPGDPEERKRIQSLIDANLGRGYDISFDKVDFDKNLSRDENLSSVEFYERFIFTGRLADNVAQKKVGEIDSLRPAIKKLGAKKLERLILQIFSALAGGEYQTSRFAEQYGISKASMSRFAGSKWREKIRGSEAVSVPDLWKNTAHILSGNPDFMEMVLTSGTLIQVEEVLRLINPNQGKKNER